MFFVLRFVFKGELCLFIDDDDVGVMIRCGDDEDGDLNWFIFNFTR